jgi:sulfur transfer protein SufE
MNDMNAAPPTNAGKVYKSNQKKTKEQSELFYVKKRGLFRKAEQVVRYCNSEVFIIVHNLDNDKIFSFASDKDFNLEKISTLVLRDCQ